MLSIIGSFEVIMYTLMIAYAIAADQKAIAGLSAVGLATLLISNITFTIYYQREVVAKDEVYAKWLYFYPKTKKLIPVVSLLLNFKSSKIIYSGFYGMESSMARFGRPMEFYNIIRMCSYFSFVFTYGFIFIADIFIFAYVKWGN